jgi:hypothetical protein
MARTKQKDDELLRLSTAAGLALPRSRSALHVATQRGEIPFTEIDGVRHYRREDIETWAKLRLREAAHLAQCHPSTVNDAAERSELASKSLNGVYYFDPRDVFAWAEKRGFLKGGDGE